MATEAAAAATTMNDSTKEEDASSPEVVSESSAKQEGGGGAMSIKVEPAATTSGKTAEDVDTKAASVARNDKEEEIQLEKEEEASIPKDRGQKQEHGGRRCKSSNDDEEEEDDRDRQLYSLRLRPEFVLDRRAPSLPPIHEMYVIQPEKEDDQQHREDDDDRNNGKGGDNNNKKKQRQHQNNKKKRPRDVHVDDRTKFCAYLVRGETCPFATCRYSHDVKLAIADRPADIKVDAFPTCPIYETFGYCPYGLNCRFGASHINMSTGVNFSQCSVVPAAPAATTAGASSTTTIANEETGTASKNDDDDNGGTTAAVPVPLPTVLNVVDRSVLIDLRKRKYAFKCQRGQNLAQMVKQEQQQTQQKAAADSATTADSTRALVESADGAAIPSAAAAEPAVAVTPLVPPVSLASAGGNNNNNNKLFDPLPSKTRKLIDFSNKVYVAPLTTVGNLPFRRVMKKLGADITCGEMAVVTCLLEGKASEWALLKRHPEEDLFGVQLAAGHPDQFARVGELIESHICADFVDLNLGCPLDIICNKGAGASLMQRDGKLRDSLYSLSYSLRKAPITVKMRTGWDEKKPFAHELVRKIQKYQIDGLAAIMVHGRSRLQRYSKDADWNYITRVVQNQKKPADDNDGAITGLSTIPIIGNGDIMSYHDYETKVLGHPDLVPCAMLGRGALIKPWLSTEIKEQRQWDISSNERMDILKDFVRFGLEHWGSDQHGVNNCRRFLLEWLSFLHRYVPIGILDQTAPPQRMNQRPPQFFMGRNDLETLFLSDHCSDWVKISELLLGPVPDGFRFEPKHKGRAYKSEG